MKEILEIGAIRKLQSPWASAVVLVHKKDGALRFCIDLRKLNARTVKDAKTLPRRGFFRHSLNGDVIFTSLDLKSGYWQVELDEESIPYTAFTVGPLGFYKCLCMLFGLTNTPATFQRLLENCLGDLFLNWCIIYLNDIIVYSKTLLTNYYRKFIHGYAKVARPLNDLVSGVNAKRKRSNVEWTDNCERAFENLKELCSNTPVLAYPDYKQNNNKLYTDASKSGLGAVMTRNKEDNLERPIAYASKTLSKSE